MRRRLLTAALIAATCAAGRADAQTAPTRVSASLGASSLLPVATDRSSTETAVFGGVRFDVRRHLAVEAAFAHWGDEQTFQSGPGLITIVGPDNTTTYGQKQSTTTHTSSATWEATMNVLARSAGRVSVFGGGGFGLGATKSEYAVSHTGCTAPSSPQVCNGYSLPRDSSGLTLQVAAGLDAMITDRVGGFASVGASAGYLYRGAFVSAGAGVRVRIR
jgi:hypothetical protein